MAVAAALCSLASHWPTATGFLILTLNLWRDQWEILAVKPFFSLLLFYSGFCRPSPQLETEVCFSCKSVMPCCCIIDWGKGLKRKRWHNQNGGCCLRTQPALTTDFPKIIVRTGVVGSSVIMVHSWKKKSWRVFLLSPHCGGLRCFKKGMPITRMCSVLHNQEDNTTRHRSTLRVTSFQFFSFQRHGTDVFTCGLWL